MPVKLADVFIPVQPDMRGFDRDVQKGATAAGQKASKGFGDTFRKSLSGGDFGKFVKTGLGLGAGLGAAGLLAGGIGKVTGAIGDAVTEAADFEAELGVINTVAKLTNEGLADLGDGIQAIAEEQGKSTHELTSAAYDLVSAGVPAARVLDVLRDSATLSTAALSGTDEAVDLITTSLNAFRIDAGESGRVMDIWATTVANGKVTASQLAASIAQVAPIAAAAGISIEEVAAAYATMTAQGTPASQAATQMRAAITALLKPNAQLVELQKQLNGTTFEQMMREEGLAATLQAVSDAAGGKTDAITAALGSTEAYNGMLQLTGGSAESFAGNLQAMRDAATEGGAAVDMMGERTDTLRHRQARLDAKVKTLKITLGQSLTPAAEGVVEVFGGIVDVVEALAGGGGKSALLEDLERHFLDVADAADEAAKETSEGEWFGSGTVFDSAIDGLHALQTTIEESPLGPPFIRRLREIEDGMRPFTEAIGLSEEELRSLAFAAAESEVSVGDAIDAIRSDWERLTTGEQERWGNYYDAFIKPLKDTGDAADETGEDLLALAEDEEEAKKRAEALADAIDLVANTSFKDLRQSAKDAKQDILAAFKDPMKPLAALAKEEKQLAVQRRKAMAVGRFDIVAMIDQRQAEIDQEQDARRKTNQFYRKERRQQRQRKKDLETLRTEYGLNQATAKEVRKQLVATFGKKWRTKVDDSELDQLIAKFEALSGDYGKFDANLRITAEQIGGRAAGGPVSAGEFYRVNEQGTESYFRPGGDGWILDAGATKDWIRELVDQSMRPLRAAATFRAETPAFAMATMPSMWTGTEPMVAGGGTQVVEHRHTIDADSASNLRDVGYDESAIAAMLLEASATADLRQVPR